MNVHLGCQLTLLTPVHRKADLYRIKNAGVYVESPPVGLVCADVWCTLQFVPGQPWFFDLCSNTGAILMVANLRC